MKKSFSILIMFALITLLGVLTIFNFEIKSIKSENLKNEYLQSQAYLHLQFLKKLTHSLKDKNIKTLTYEENLFILTIEKYGNRHELFVQAKDQTVRLHETIIK